MISSRTCLPTLLITAAGTGMGWAYALALAQQFPDVRLITADINAKPWVSAALMAEHHVRWPLFSPGEVYLDRLNALIREHAITHYLPIIDPEIAFAAHHVNSIEAKVIAVDASFSDMASGKKDYELALRPLGIATPGTLSRQDVEGGAKAYAKLSGGFGGRAVWLVDDREKLKDLPADVYLQEAIDGSEFTADCFPTNDADIVFCSVRERIETKSGVCTKARIMPHPVMEEYAKRLVQNFRISHPFCFQAIGKDRLVVTDINPRLGGGTMMSVANGSDFFGAHLAQSFGYSWRDRLKRHHQSCAITRQYIELVAAE